MQNDICWREGTRWSRMTGLWPLSELSDMLWKWWSMACWRGSKCSKNLPKEHHLLTAYVIHSLSWHPTERMYAWVKERRGAKHINICLCAHLSWLTPWESGVNIWTAFFTQRHAFFSWHVFVKSKNVKLSICLVVTNICFLSVFLNSSVTFIYIKMYLKQILHTYK